MSEADTLGLIRIGSMDLAIPAALIEEILRGPVELTPFPQAPVHVLGAFARRGAPVPVIDLAALLQPVAAGGPPAPVAYVVVIRHAAGRFAVLADAILGVVRAGAERISELDPGSPQGAGLFSRLYTPKDGGRVAVILDLDAVLAAEGLRSAVVRDADAASRDANAMADGRERPRAHVLFRAGGVGLALDARHVRLVERRTRGLDSPLPHPLLRGFHRFRDEELPVVDLPGLLALAPVAGRTETEYFLVAQHGALAVALGVDEIVAIESFPASAVNALPEGGMTRPEFFTGGRVGPGGDIVLVLEPGTLLAGASLVDRAALFAREADGASPADDEANEPVQYLVYGAGGGMLATALLELEAVVRLPEDFVDLRGRGRALVGLASRLGHSFKIVDLGALLGRPDPKAGVGSPVLIVRGRGGLTGYLVESIDFLQTAAARSLSRPGQRGAGVLPPFRKSIRARSGGRDLAPCVLSLAELNLASGEDGAADPGPTRGQAVVG